MSHNELETSRYGGSPIELYLFRYGDGAFQYHGFTDSVREVVHEGLTYVPAAIDRGDDEASGNRDRKDMSIKMSGKNPILDFFDIYPPDYPISLTIRTGHDGDPDEEFVVTYSGGVINAKDSGTGQSVIVCRTTAAYGRMAGLRRNYQYGCPYVLYGGDCKASKDARKQTASVSSLSLNSLVFAPGWEGPLDAEKYTGGYVQFTSAENTVSRKIIRVEAADDELVLSGPTGDLAIGDPVDIYPGCGLNATDCFSIHDNIENYGGQLWIPLENPVNRNTY
jgi:hypothetical protein